MDAVIFHKNQLFGEGFPMLQGIWLSWYIPPILRVAIVRSSVE